ncbi:MAG: Xaa-Pro aminopeptidase [Chromatiales bacterium]|nr:Xaa-Pro aminopeptidase [Chromatiales bacterium]
MKATEFKRRRKQLMRIMGPDSIAILPASPVAVRNRDVEYPYRPDSDFFYLTGFPEPESVAVLAPGRPHGEFVLFCRERNPTTELWTGRMAGQEGAIEEFGADDSFPIDDLDDILPGMLEKVTRVYYTMGQYGTFDQRLMDWVRRLRERARAGVHAPIEFVSLDHFLHDLRLYKSRAEIALMRKAADIAAAGHLRAMQVCEPGMTEYQIEAELTHEFIRRGARAHAYPAIVAAGENACVLHYTENRAPLADGDLLLIDAGAEVDCYASDITRTFPVNGRFTPAQRAIYDLVLDAQYAAIDAIKPGVGWNEPHDAAVKVLARGLSKLRILKETPAQALKKQTYKRFYMHRTGHWLGMDVHDVGDYMVGDAWRMLEPGMVMTVEPGLYIPPGASGIAKKWWGIGVRIEDDVVVTKTGSEVLTDAVPKAADAVEAAMAA